MNTTTSAAPDWFHNRVVSGVQFLLALGLPGTPAAEVVTLTATAWITALWAAPIAWCDELDNHRLYQAFMAVAVKAERWPSPRQLLDQLPPRPEPLALRHTGHAPTPEQRAALASLCRRFSDTHRGAAR